ncbi:hypothetical protein [Hymenobacter swuensis]|uniref:Uncharacterized protein n=1 Tax=Hymenobacter swuensis DY53 TaxID=1227739 RepID=W8EQF3_9BACT|nr:hypothetical protein [Hymenobacter swuensis]AHJ95394.1 hypothetical protein Hsw_PA0061 [Hymenobacter swuensis DY53]
MSFPRTLFTHGLLLGLTLCLYATLMWLTRLATTYLSIGQYLDIHIMLAPVGFIIAAIHQQRRHNANG